MSLTYTTYVTDLANLLVVPIGDSGFQTVLPNIIDDASLRMYRDLDLLATVDVGYTALDATQRFQSVNVSQGSPVVIKEINVITPLGAAVNIDGTRNSLVPVSNEMINALYTSRSGSAVPQYFAVVALNTISVGPWPDASYMMEIVATFRPPPLSSTITTTVLTEFFPDLFMAASMVFASAYQRNFGAAVDDPKMGPTWESHYQSLLVSANTEENRKRLSEHAQPTQQQPSRT